MVRICLKRAFTGPLSGGATCIISEIIAKVNQSKFNANL